MAVRMNHAEHGSTYAYGKADIERLQACGWTIAPPKTVVEQPKVAETEKRKPGRPAKAK